MSFLYDVEISLRAMKDISANRRRRNADAQSAPTELLLCIADHFEPQVAGADKWKAQQRLGDWLTQYPQIADRHKDADGRRPAHTFFYPWDEYDQEEFVPLQAMCAAGYGEIEVHLHHRDDTEASLRQKFEQAMAAYRTNGALSAWPDGRTAFGFVHGNWALDNSRQDNGRNYCGVNSEIRLLSELGCYADFTFPAWQQTAQPRITNTIYYATDDPQRPKSHEYGVIARTGRSEGGDLLLIQGPLTPFWYRSGRIARPAMDDGDLASYRRYKSSRLDRWIHAGIHVAGRPDRVFIKLHCHGAADSNREALLGTDLNALFTDAENRYNDGARYRLHYVTAREMFNIVRATEVQPDLDIGSARNFVLDPPAQPVRHIPDDLMEPVAEGVKSGSGSGKSV